MRILKIETLEPQSKNWHDRDEIMLHACFQLLKDCIEKEGLFEHSPHYAKSKNGKKAKELYDWWEVRKTKEFSYSIKDDLIQDKIDNQKLIELIKIRGGLWT